MIIGVLLIFLALIHIFFPKYFNWATEFNSVSLLNRQMFYIHTLFIALAVMMMGVLCLTSAQDLIETRLGNKIALGLGIFWFVRLVVQFFGYSSTLWRGKRFETIIHIIFSIAWVYLSSVFLYIYWASKFVV